MANVLRVKFNGADYVPERDNPRLVGQLLRIWDVVSGGRWFTLAEISKRTGDPEASISAQLRHLRKERFGAHEVERERIKDGLYKYRVIANIQRPKDTSRKARNRRKWVGLDDDEIIGMTCDCIDDGTFNMDCAIDFARAIEAELKKRNVPQP